MDIHDGGVDLLITGFLSFVIIAAVSWILTQLIDAPLIRLCKRGVTYFFIKREENSLS
jgi:peptidoglycan/LPS O-acetylase OafA/YrhL